MSLLGAIGGIQSVLGAIGGNRAGKKMAGEGEDWMRKGIDAHKNGLQQMQDYYQRRIAEGGFDPRKRFNSAEAAARRVLGINQNNFVARHVGNGYKPGDSLMQQGFGQMNAKASLDAMRLHDEMEQQAWQDQYGVLNGMADQASRFGQSARDYGQQMYDRGVSMQQANNPAAAVSGFIQQGAGDKNFWNFGRQFRSDAETRGLLGNIKNMDLRNRVENMADPVARKKWAKGAIVAQGLAKIPW